MTNVDKLVSFHISDRPSPKYISDTMYTMTLSVGNKSEWFDLSWGELQKLQATINSVLASTPDTLLKRISQPVEVPTQTPELPDDGPEPDDHNAIAGQYEDEYLTSTGVY